MSQVELNHVTILWNGEGGEVKGGGRKDHIVSRARIGEFLPENCQFLEINLQELEVFWPEISFSWGIKKEENSLNSLILVTISWRRKNIFFIKKFWWVFFYKK